MDARRAEEFQHWGGGGGPRGAKMEFREARVGYSGRSRGTIIGEVRIEEWGFAEGRRGGGGAKPLHKPSVS